MTLSISGRIRKRLADLLWPHVCPTLPVLPPTTFAADGLTTEHASAFLDDPLFRRAYAAGEATGSWFGMDIRWRAYVVCWAARRGQFLGGDFVECGVNRGGYSRMLAEYVDLASMPGRKLYLIDTYRGLPEEFDDSEYRHPPGTYTDCYDDVVRTFAPFPNAVIIRGAIPPVLAKVQPERVCYLSIDLNCVAPSIRAAEHFWPRMTGGAIMVLDDYGFLVYHDQKAAFDDFARSQGTEVLSLPTGQGLLIKP